MKNMNECPQCKLLVDDLSIKKYHIGRFWHTECYTLWKKEWEYEYLKIRKIEKIERKR